MAQYSVKTVKFGGSSLADAEQYKKAKKIIQADRKRRYIVASAPGKRFADDIKVTDLLYNGFIEKAFDRYNSIIRDLALSIDLTSEYKKIINNANSTDYIVSRGEYLNAKIFARYIGYDFIDSAEVIIFDNNGVFDEIETNKRLAEALSLHKNAVIGGFYGATPDGEIKTFSRGGSDITGSLVAKAVNAEVYENWTDVSGVMTISPDIISSPLPIEKITFDELYILSKAGAGVFHEDALAPLKDTSISIVIKNTNAPDDNGTYILHNLPDDSKSVVGISGFINDDTATVVVVIRADLSSEILSSIENAGIDILSAECNENSVFINLSKEDFKKTSIAVYKEFIG